MNEENFFSGNVLDRASELRTNTELIGGLLKKTGTNLLLFKACQPLVEESDGKLDLTIFKYEELNKKFDLNGRDLIFLGKERNDDEIAWFAVNATEQDHLDSVLTNQRKIAANRFDLMRLKSDHASIASQAKSMLHWHDRYKFCPTCGMEMFMEEAGYKRTCKDKSCRSNQGVHNTCYPRTDPSVIMCVVSGNRCLLGRKAIFPKNMYSCLAGFLEPGESIEDAVVRETKEESDIDVTDITYVSSQPWPFPSSLMIGCLARATSDSIQICEEEMEDVRWFDHTEVQLALEKKSQVLRLPPKEAIAHQLIKHWMNGLAEETPPSSSL